MNQVKINEKYKPLYLSNKRYFLVVGGRASGKSFSSSDYLLRLTYEKGHGILFTRYTMTSAETSIIPEFKNAIERLGVEDHFDITSKDIYNKITGSFIWFRGIKASSNSQKANLKSLAGVTTFVIEEGEDFHDEKTFDTIDDSIRTKAKQNRVIWVQNPSDKEHFIYKRWIEKNNKKITIDGFQITVSNHPDVETIHTTYLDNIENLSESFIKKAKKTRETNPDWYVHNYLGGWIERPEGVIFDNWEEGEFNNELPYGFGMDFGYSNDPTTLVKVAVDRDNKVIYLKELLYKTGMVTYDIVSVLKEVTNQDELIIADSAEPRLIDEIWNEGFNIKPCIKGPDSIRTGIRLMQGYKLIVDSESQNLKNELNNYRWHDNRSGKPIDDHNHCFIGSTLITTDKGKKKIKDILPGDLVLTSKGYRKVLKKFDNGVKRVNEYSILFDTFSVSLTCTKDHKIKTSKEWKEIQNLKKGDKVYLNKYSMEKNTFFTKEKDIFQKVIKGFTGLFGNITMAIFQAVIIFIILTEILITIKLKIFLLSTVHFILDLLQRKDLKIIRNGRKNFIEKELKKQKTGTNQKKVLNGTKNKLKDIVLENGIYLKKNVINAIKLLNPKRTRQNFVQIIARVNLEENKELIISKKLVSFAEKIIQSTSMQEQKLAEVNVVRSYEENVFDLMIEDQHEYFANGVLVHNCVDSIRYYCSYILTENEFFVT